VPWKSQADFVQKEMPGVSVTAACARILNLSPIIFNDFQKTGTVSYGTDVASKEQRAGRNIVGHSMH